MSLSKSATLLGQHDKATASLMSTMALVICAVMFSGFFFGANAFIHSYIFAKLWNLGHLVFFCLFSLLLLHFRPEPQWYRGLAKTSLCALFSGLVIEALQSVIGRQASVSDIGLNIIGAGCASLWFYRQQQHWGKKPLWVLYSAALILALIPLFLGGSNFLLGRWQYPVLLNFDYRLERIRLTGNAEIGFQQHQGKQGAKIRFGNQQYSGFTVTKIPSDWSKQQQLVIELDNLETTPIALTCRIHDTEHNQAYDDRFNQSWTLPSGEQRLEIAITDIAKAAKNRTLDVSQIAGFGCFTIKAAKQPTLFLQSIYLR